MNPTGKTQLLRQLKRMAKDGPANTIHGICPNLHHVDLGSGTFLKELWNQWPYHSGNQAYPIPASRTQITRESAENAYFDHIELWDRNTEYGQLRWELLDWTIAQLESQLSKP